MKFPCFRRHRIWAWGVTASLGIFAAGYCFRGPVLRAYVAIRFERLHILVPEKPVGFWSEVRFYWDLAGLREQRDQRFKHYMTELEPLVKEISTRQREGKNVALSDQIYREIQWWVNFTPDAEMTERRIADLRASLAPGADQSSAGRQNPSDGSWGAGYSVWFMKLYSAVDEFLSRGAVPEYPMQFIDRINSPEKLTEHMNVLLRDDFTRTHVINRGELDDTTSAVARLLFGDARGHYRWQPGVADAFLRFLDQWQNPATGCWGVWLVGRDGTIWREDDVGITFHIVSDCGDRVGHFDRIARRVLQLTDIDFPAGIRMQGHYENHLNWDVVKILRAAWPDLDERTRSEGREQISRMLNWCLTDSYQPDGSFKVSAIDDTPIPAMEYGYRFLRDIGYFDRRKRFWTDQEFPQADSIRRRIETRFTAMGISGGPAAETDHSRIRLW